MSTSFAVIFDMDGILIDSEPTWQEIEIEVLGALGAPINVHNVHTTTGWRIDRVVDYWRERAGFAGDTDAIARQITQKVADRIQQIGEPLPGAITLLHACTEEKIPIGLATSSSHILIDSVLERLKIRDLFSAIASASEVPKGKPDPAV